MFFKNKIQKKVMAIFILFEQCVFKRVKLQEYLKVSKTGSHKEYYS